MGFVEHRPVGQFLVDWLDIGQNIPLLSSFEDSWTVRLKASMFKSRFLRFGAGSEKAK